MLHFQYQIEWDTLFWHHKQTTDSSTKILNFLIFWLPRIDNNKRLPLLWIFNRTNTKQKFHKTIESNFEVELSLLSLNCLGARCVWGVLGTDLRPKSSGPGRTLRHITLLRLFGLEADITSLAMFVVWQAHNQSSLPTRITGRRTLRQKKGFI